MGKQRFILIFLLSVFLLTLWSCGGGKSEEASLSEETGNAQEAGSDLLWNCAWYVYWDAEVEMEFTLLEDKVASASMFSCFFTEKGSVHIPENFSALKRLAGKLEVSKVYLSITNDVICADGSTAQKDADSTKTLLAGEGEKEAAADKILTVAEAMDVQGIEIDFENVEEPGLWAEYLQFLNVMWEKTREKGLSMRVVLSVKAPADDFDLPDGPEYTVMCYNLYGTHSGPGPKADAAFLAETAERFSGRDNMVYALAAGGFQWSGDGQTVRALTEKEAKYLACEHEITPERDEASGALFFSYAEDGEAYTVWYADGETLLYWRNVISQTDADALFDLWRVGGNLW